MKLFVKPSVKASERFFVRREVDASEVALRDLAAALVTSASGDDVVVSAGGVVPADGQVAEFLLGVSVDAGRERLLSVRRAEGADAWNGAVALELQRALRRGQDVFVLHGVVDRVAGVESVTVWSAEVHVVPDRSEVFETAVQKSPVKFKARMQEMAEVAWGRVCTREGVTCGLPVPEAKPNEVVVDERPLSAEDELMLMVPEGWDEDAPMF